MPGAAPGKHKTAMEAAQHDVRNGETLALFDAPQQAYTRELLAAAHLA